MNLSPVEWVLVGYQSLNLLSAIQSALPHPKKEGWYSFFYLVLKAETNNLSNYFQDRYHMSLPSVTEQTSSLQITHPDGSVKTKADSLVTSTPVVTVVPTDFIK
jgi:hypothetical protein